MADIWQPVKPVPTRREEEERKAKLAAERAKPKPVLGKPGFSVDGDGHLSYDPGADPKGQAYK
jgi:hypothetical protein